MSFDIHEVLLPSLTYDDFVLMAQNCNPESTTLRDEVRRLLAQRRNELWEMFLEHEEDIMKAAFPEQFPVELTHKGKHVYTKGDFRGYGALAVFDLVDGEVVQDLMDLLPPAYYSSSLAQVGEPCDSVRADDDQYYPTYATFRFIAMEGEHEVWEFCGDCLRGHTTK
ncbi:hypothetical protein B5G34_00500 [Flavonifractor sp. An82]|uniref:hypothetical protein n=1 Tax=Flavonifractor sp. An82 TaxID=1965660 RepID=UPI000B36E8AD|nr:hypothetical protein [Flavonifractor sp. An82]OUN23613.1 hypothetical protein B5G34_00500 [Flavonifractor sp. An82]